MFITLIIMGGLVVIALGLIAGLTYRKAYDGDMVAYAFAGTVLATLLIGAFGGSGIGGYKHDPLLGGVIFFSSLLAYGLGTIIGLVTGKKR